MMGCFPCLPNKARGPQVTDGPELEKIASSIQEIAMQVVDASVSPVLVEHAACLRRIAGSSCDGEKDGPANGSTLKSATTATTKRAFRRSSAILDVLSAVPTPMNKTAKKNRRNSLLAGSVVGFRDMAVMEVGKTGRPGELVDDLEEVHIRDVKNKSAIGYWRCCHGVRVYRSKTVTNALRLICSAPVPGLEGLSYLDVFNKLTSGADWEHHIYLFGGLVRDIIRRKVGNDIDICFTAPAVELDQTCQKHGYKCNLDGDYILIGDEKGEEYLEGMVITHNGINAAYHSDFSMNWLFYDFCNDIIVDKTGRAVTAVIANRCEIPCPGHEWIKWVETGGSMVLFRYYKFLVRGYEYEKAEMAYIANHLLCFWAQNAEDTESKGRVALASLASSAVSDKKVEYLRKLVLESYQLAASSRTSSTPTSNLSFSSGSSWWEAGWMPMLKLTQ